MLVELVDVDHAGISCGAWSGDGLQFQDVCAQLVGGYIGLVVELAKLVLGEFDVGDGVAGFSDEIEEVVIGGV